MTGRVKGFATWRPQKKTQVLIEDIERVLEEYRSYLPMTVRQVFYRLVGLGHPKSEGFYDKVQDVCNRARRSGRISFAAIRDDGVSRQDGETPEYCYEDPEEYYETHEALGNYYKRSWHVDQPAYVSVLCEASGMVPMVARAVRDYRVPVASSSGFDSLTVKHDLFREALRREVEFSQRTILLHLGDHDPSGVSVYESMAEDLDAFGRDRGQEGLIEVRRVALTPLQIRALSITTQPDEVKPSDSRARSFIERGLEPAAQLEAIPPDTLSAIVRQAVESTLDLDILAASRAQENAEYEEVQRKLDVVNEALREAFGLHE